MRIGKNWVESKVGEVGGRKRLRGLHRLVQIWGWERGGPRSGRVNRTFSGNPVLLAACCPPKADS